MEHRNWDFTGIYRVLDGLGFACWVFMGKEGMEWTTTCSPPVGVQGSGNGKGTGSDYILLELLYVLQHPAKHSLRPLPVQILFLIQH